MNMIHECEKYIIEYFNAEGGLLSIEFVETGKSYMIGLRNSKGRCVVRGQFKDSVKTHGIDKAVEVFCKLALK
jgi:hypothetical protein